MSKAMILFNRIVLSAALVMVPFGVVHGQIDVKFNKKLPGGAEPVDLKTLPEGARVRLGNSSIATGNVYYQSAAISPDGKTLALTTGGQQIRLIDLETNKEIRTITLKDYLRYQSIQFTKDGTQVVTTTQTGILFSDVKDGSAKKTLATRDPNGRDAGFRLSSDEKFVVIGGQGEGSKVRLVEVETGKATEFAQLQNNQAFGVLSPDGKVLITYGYWYARGVAGEDPNFARTIQVWDAKTGKETAKVVTHCMNQMDVQFSPDGAQYAVGGRGVVCIYETATNKLVRKLTGRSEIGQRVAFSNDGKQSAASSTDGSVQSWEVATGKRLEVSEGRNVQTAALQYRPDGEVVAVSINGTMLDMWELKSGKRLTPDSGHRGPISSITFSLDGKTLYSSAQNDVRNLIWEVETGREKGQYIPQEFIKKGTPASSQQIGSVMFSPNRQWLVTGSANGNGYLALWDAKRGFEVASFFNATNGQYVDRSGIVAFSPDSKRVVALSRYGGNREKKTPLNVIDVEGGDPVPDMVGQMGDFTGAGFSTDGKLLAVASYYYPPNGGQASNDIWIWDTTTGKNLYKINTPTMQAQTILFLDHRQFVAHQQNTGNVFLFDAMSGAEIRKLEIGGAPNQGYAMTVGLSEDRRLIALSYHQHQRYERDGKLMPESRKVYLVEACTGNIRAEYPLGQATCQAIAFSRDGKQMALGLSDTSIVLYDLALKAGEVEIKEAELTACWQDLGSMDAKKGFEAMKKLFGRPEQAAELIAKELKPMAAKKVDADAIAKLISDLDAPRFAVRENAAKELERLGRVAKKQVDAALDGDKISVEVRDRLEKLKDKLNRPDLGEEWVRPLRAIEVLEKIGSPRAVEHLKVMANGGDSPPTRAAQAVLERMEQK